MKKYLTNRNVLMFSLLIGVMGLFILYKYVNLANFFINAATSLNDVSDDYLKANIGSAIKDFSTIYKIDLAVAAVAVAGHGYLKFIEKREDRSTLPMLVCSAVILIFLLTMWSGFSALEQMMYVENVFESVGVDAKAAAMAFVKLFLVGFFQLIYVAIAGMYYVYGKEIGLNMETEREVEEVSYQPNMTVNNVQQMNRTLPVEETKSEQPKFPNLPQ